MTQNRGLRIDAWLLSLLILVAAIGVSSYLSYLKFDDVAAVCVQGGSFDCGTVLNSVYSELMGIPIAYLGLFTNLVIVALLLLEKRAAMFREYGPILTFGVVLFATVFSVYLIYIQAAVIGAYCPWCLTHEALIFALFGLVSWRLYKHYNGTLYAEADNEINEASEPATAQA